MNKEIEVRVGPLSSQLIMVPIYIFDFKQVGLVCMEDETRWVLICFFVFEYRRIFVTFLVE